MASNSGLGGGGGRRSKPLPPLKPLSARYMPPTAPGASTTASTGGTRRRWHRIQNDDPDEIGEAAAVKPGATSRRGAAGTCRGSCTMAARYVWTEARRNRRDVCVGIWTIALVVGFMSLLQVLCCVLCVVYVAPTYNASNAGCHWSDAGSLHRHR